MESIEKEKDLVERRQVELEWRLSQGEEQQEQAGGRWEQLCGGEQQLGGEQQPGGEQPLQASGSRWLGEQRCEECARRERGRGKITKSASPSPRQRYTDIETMWKRTIEKVSYFLILFSSTFGLLSLSTKEQSPVKIYLLELPKNTSPFSIIIED